MRDTFVVCALCALVSPSALAITTLDKLTIEGRTEPIGIDVTTPRFGWAIKSDKRNVVQKSYRIMVSTEEDGQGNVWDSGTIKSDSSQWVTYKGVALRPNTRYYWRVEVKTNKDKATWSKTASWTTGLLNENNWQGQWIGTDSLVEGDRAERHSRLVARCLRKTFKCEGTVKRATMHISGLGLYTLYINSKRIGNGVMTPAPTDYNKTIAYDTYDVTHQIGQQNAIGVTLEGGHYFAQTQKYQTNVRTTYGMSKLRACLIIEYADGRRETVSTDSTWKLSTDGPIRYANEYDGEFFDARKAKDFSATDFDDSNWTQAQTVSAPNGEMRGNITPQMTVYATELPTNIRTFGQRMIVDFGTNNAGRISLNIDANNGDTIRIRHAELLEKGDSTLYTKNLRSAEATAWFVSDGKQRHWSPEFTYYGFRYAEITIPDGCAITSIQRELISDEMEDNGNVVFIGGEEAETLNKIMANARQGIKSDYKGFPVDCPQRDERMPWLGDRTVGSTGESYMIDNHALYTKWLGDIRDSQLEDGGISDVSPAYWRLYHTNVTWPAALPFTADMIYRQYGDIQPMRDSYEAIGKWMRLVRNSIYKDGLVTYDRYGDWCVPPEEQNLVHSKDPKRKTDGTLLSSTYYYHICRMMQRYATMFGNITDATYYDKEASITKEAINKRFLSNGTYANSTATANILPLAMGIVPDSCRKAVEQSLLNTIVEKNDTHICCGVVGIQWIMRLLTDLGYGDVAFKMATATTYPGWGYMVSKGATTIWELWNGDTADPSMNSGNHVMLLGDLLPWCYERLGGIRPDDNRTGFKHIIMQPDFSIEALNGVEANHRSPYGNIHSSWKRTNDSITWNVAIPANTTAELRLPNGDMISIGSGEHTFNCPNRKARRVHQ